MNRFFITGLPRSRTAWLSNFFTYKDSYCFHELINYGSNYMELHHVMANRAESYIGTADCGVPFYFDDIVQLSELWRLAIVERDPIDVFNSLTAFFGTLNDEQKKFFDMSLEKLEILKNRYDPHIIKYEDLDNITEIEHLWYHLIPGLHFDPDRYTMINRMNIQPEKKKFLDNLNKENVRQIMGV